MISNQYDMLCSLKDWDKCLWLCCLSCFINKDLREPKLLESSVKSCHTSSANDLSILQNLILSLSFQVLQLFVFFLIQITLLFLFKEKVLHDLEWSMIEMLDLFMQRKIVDVRAD